MKRYINVAAVCLLAVVLLGLQAPAQIQPSRCPAGVTNPDTLLGGGAATPTTTWVYQIQGVSYWGAAAAGQFTARVSAAVGGANPRPAANILDVIDSSSIAISNNFGGSPLPPNAGLPLLSRLQPYNGRWSVNADCSGGVLHLNSNLNPNWSYDFWFSNSTFTEMVLVSTEIGRVYIGTARRVL
jgi:hypothetical protein